LKTERLEMLPLDLDNLRLAVEDYQKMEKQLGLKITNTVLDEEMTYAMKVRHRKVLEDEANTLWLTNWAIILKEQNCIIGFIILKGYPNEHGEVIVGYGIEEHYRLKGYATEALKGITEWIFKNPKVKCVIADTDRENLASHKVLENAGATRYKETEELIWWRVSKF
jgi:[ribosomal protein S5]-alanine N-acetyltransferase